MLDFQPITAALLTENRALITASDVRLCDYAPGCLFMWREFYRVRACIAEGMLICCAGVVDPHTPAAETDLYYSFPVGGGDLGAAVRAIIADSAERGVPLRFSVVPEDQVARLEALVGRPAAVDPDSTDPDYLYPIGNFLGYPGKSLHAHRNHVNRFLRENPGCSFAPLSAENREVAAAFLHRHHNEMEKPDALAMEELLRAEELILCSEQLGLSGGVLFVNGEVVGVTVGETVGDVLHVDVEKALTEYHGAFQFLAQSFAQMMHENHPELVYINRQDDCGDDGLRQSKQSYKPCALLKKCAVSFD